MQVELTLEELHLLNSLVWARHRELIKGYNDVSIENAPPSVLKMLSMLDDLHSKISNSTNEVYENLYSRV